MPLRDHFRPPISTRSSWEALHGGWPMAIVQELAKVLPERFTAEPRVHLGAFFEVEVAAYEHGQPNAPRVEAANGGLATATLAPPEPTLVVDADLGDQYEYEVLIYDQSRARQLVAAIEVVSPANKDRPDNRRVFAAKCVRLLLRGVCVSIVDLIGTRHFNLYCEMLKMIDRSDPLFGATPPAMYAATCRGRRVAQAPRFESWAYPLAIGEALPKLPIWLTEEQWVWLDLDASYEETCRALRISAAPRSPTIGAGG